MESNHLLLKIVSIVSQLKKVSFNYISIKIPLQFYLDIEKTIYGCENISWNFIFTIANSFYAV